MTSNKSNSAFTLLEILLVVGIIAILAGIVIIAINPSKQLASVRNTQRLSDLKQLNNAITQFYIDKGTYPASSSLSTTTLKEICNTGSVSLATTSIDGINCATAGLTNLSELVPTYIVAIPVDPSGASSTMTLIPTAYAAIGGNGYKIMKTASNQIIEQAPLAELNVPVSIGNVSLSVAPPLNISGLVAHYLMNDTNGTTAIDRSGNGNTGTGTYSTTAGRVNGGLSMNGSTDYLDAGNGASITLTNEITISAWVKFNSLGNYPDYNIVVAKYLGSSPPANYLLAIRNMTGHKNNSINMTFGDGFFEDSGSIPNITTGAWYHLACVGKVGQIPVCYVNNIQVTGTYKGITTSVPTTGNLRIGWDQSTENKLNGYIDDVRIYNRVLSQAEISQIYNAGNGTEAE